MANTILGKQILWGCGSIAITLAGKADPSLLQDIEWTSQSEKERIKNTDGNTAALAYTDHEQLITLNFYPDTGNSTAWASLAATVMNTPGATLKVVDTLTDWTSGTYAVDKVRQAKSNSKATMWTFDLCRYPNATCPSA